MRTYQKSILSIAIFSSLAIATPVSAQVSVAPLETECQSVIVPAYFYPGETWDELNSLKGIKKIGIYNPASGSGKEINTDYVDLLKESTDIMLPGYVYVNYGRRDSSLVKAEIDNYFNWYGTKDIFLDGISSGKEDIAYFKEISDYIKQKGGTVIFNPGLVPDEEYVSIADIIVVTEGKYENYKDKKFADWVYKYPASKFAHLVYDTPKESFENAISLSKERNAGYVYITDDNGDNPWDTLPTYWDEEVNKLCVTATTPDTVSEVTEANESKPASIGEYIISFFLSIWDFIKNLFK